MGVFGVLRGFGEEFGEACCVEVAQEFAVFLERVRHGICGGCVFARCRELAIHNRLECCYFKLYNGDVGIRAFLNIDKAYFNGTTIKAGDGTTTVQEEMIEQVFGIVRGDSLLNFVKNHLVVFIVAVRLFRDDLACDFRDFVLVVAVNFDAGVAIAGVFAVEIRAAGGNGGD